jgi:hypothetical protein
LGVGCKGLQCYGSCRYVIGLTQKSLHFLPPEVEDLKIKNLLGGITGKY